jgi:hypothetical protein
LRKEESSKTVHFTFYLDLKNISSELQIFLDQLLEVDYKKRLTAEKALESKWLAQKLKGSKANQADINQMTNNLQKY